MQVHFSVFFLCPSENLGSFKKRIRHILSLNEFEGDSNFFPVKFDEARGVIDEYGNESISVNDLNIISQLSEYEGFSQEYFYEGSEIYSIAYQKKPYIYLYVDFNVRCVDKLISSKAGVKRFYDLLVNMYKAFSCLALIGDFDFPFALRSQNDSMENFIANPDNNNFSCSIGVFHRFDNNKINPRLNVSDWDILGFDSDLVLYVKKDFSENIKLMVG